MLSFRLVRMEDRLGLDLRADAANLLPGLIDLRRRLHTYPEVGFDLPRTQAALLEALAPLNLEVTTGEALSSVTAVLRGETDGPSVLLRGDMDALPIIEQTGLSFASSNGAMHACGHDMHMAGLVGAARLLTAHREQIAGSVVFMFQPAEEAGGGAPLMIREGVLAAAGRRVEAAYALHVGPGPRGVFQLKDGPVLAGANAVKVRIHGRSGHAARPHLATDPVPVVAELVLAVQSWIARRFDAFDPVVLTVTKLYAGDSLNVVPDEAGFSGTLRTLSEESLNRIRDELPELVDRLAAAYGCTAQTEVIVGYPATVNSPHETNAAERTLRKLFGGTRVQRMPAPVMASEDFSYVLNEVPGSFLFFRTTPEGVDPTTAAGNHSSTVVYDDGLLADQAAALAALALQHVRTPS